MTAAVRLLLLPIVVAIFAQLIRAQESREVTIKEPGIYELTELLKQADTVARLLYISRSELRSFPFRIQPSVIC